MLVWFYPNSNQQFTLDEKSFMRFLVVLCIFYRKNLKLNPPKIVIGA